jgi:hypothetical protein
MKKTTVDRFNYYCKEHKCKFTKHPCHVLQQGGRCGKCKGEKLDHINKLIKTISKREITLPTSPLTGWIEAIKEGGSIKYKVCVPNNPNTPLKSFPKYSFAKEALLTTLNI